MANGWETRRQVVPHEAVEDALRVINLELWRASTEDLERYAKHALWFPDLAEHDERILRLKNYVGVPEDTWDEAWSQIILQWPHNPANPYPPLNWHRDDKPWNGGEYVKIACVPLTIQGGKYGGLLFDTWEMQKYVHYYDPGDVVIMDGDAVHSGGTNVSGQIRYSVYFRYVKWN